VRPSAAAGSDPRNGIRALSRDARALRPGRLAASGARAPGAGRADGRGGDRLGLRLFEYGVEVSELGRRLTRVDASGDVRAVADAVIAGECATEVAQHHFARFDDPWSRFVMGTGGIGPTRHDGEVDPVVPFGDETPTDVVGHGGLGAADQLDVALLELPRNPVGGAGRRPQRRDLVDVFDGPQRGEHLAGPDEPRVREAAHELDEEARPRLIADGRDRGRAGQTGDEVDGVVGLVPELQGEHVGTFDHSRSFESGHDERGVAVSGHDQHREPFERHGFVAGEPRQVGPDRQEQHVDRGLGHRLTHASQPCGVPVGHRAATVPPAAACRAW
jgi:hypothetical protein